MAADSGFFLIICGFVVLLATDLLEKAKSQGHDALILAKPIRSSAPLAQLEELINRPDETGLAI